MIDARRVLLPLNEAGPAIRSLRSPGPDTDLAADVLAVDAAVERSLRLLLREAPDVPDDLRLPALSADHVPFDRLLSALGEHRLISVSLAGEIHGLRAAAERAATEATRSEDAAVALATVDRLRDEVDARVGSPHAGPASPEADPVELPGSVATKRSADAGARRSRTILVVVFAVALVAAAVWISIARGSGPMSRGIDAFRQERLEDARGAFETVVDRDSTNVTARLYLARVLRRQGDARGAAEQLRIAADLSPDDPDVRRELGHLFYDLGSYRSAAEQYQRALQAQPGEPMNWIGAIRALRADGDPRAEDLLREAPAEARQALGAH